MLSMNVLFQKQYLSVSKEAYALKKFNENELHQRIETIWRDNQDKLVNVVQYVRDHDIINSQKLDKAMSKFVQRLLKQNQSRQIVKSTAEDLVTNCDRMLRFGSVVSRNFLKIVECSGGISTMEIQDMHVTSHEWQIVFSPSVKTLIIRGNGYLSLPTLNEHCTLDDYCKNLETLDLSGLEFQSIDQLKYSTENYTYLHFFFTKLISYKNLKSLYMPNNTPENIRNIADFALFPRISIKNNTSSK